MKCITREVKMYRYIFANIDLETGTAYNLKEFFKPSPMGQREIRRYCEDNNQAVLIRKEEIPTKYSLPLDRFVVACSEYAALVEAGEAPEITEADELETDDSEETEEDID